MNSKINEMTDLFKEIPGISAKVAQRIAINMVENHELSLTLEKILDLNSELVMDELTGLILPLNTIANENKEKDVLLILESNKELLNVVGKTNSNKSIFILGMENKRDFKNTEKVLNRLFKTIKEYNTKEVLFLLTPSIESELIMRVVKEELENSDLPNKPKLTRLSMGIPFGGSIEFSDERTIKEAMKNRKEFKNN